MRCLSLRICGAYPQSATHFGRGVQANLRPEHEPPAAAEPPAVAAAATASTAASATAASAASAGAPAALGEAGG